MSQNNDITGSVTFHLKTEYEGHHSVYIKSINYSSTPQTRFNNVYCYAKDKYGYQLFNIDQTNTMLSSEWLKVIDRIWIPNVSNTSDEAKITLTNKGGFNEEQLINIDAVKIVRKIPV
jgi:hypothetical protein